MDDVGIGHQKDWLKGFPRDHEENENSHIYYWNGKWILLCDDYVYVHAHGKYPFCIENLFTVHTVAL